MKLAPIIVGGMVSCSVLAGVAQDPAPLERTVDGITIYLGIAPPGAIDVASRDSMRHGLPPWGTGGQLVTIALYDAKTGNRISNARVTAFLPAAGQARSARVLQPETIAGATTFETSMAMPGPGPYELRVEVQLPGSDTSTRRTSFVVAPRH